MKQEKTPTKVIKIYVQGIAGKRQRHFAESKLFEEGYTIQSEEEFKEWMAGNACCLALLFPPLIFIKTKKLKVTYVRSNI